MLNRLLLFLCLFISGCAVRPDFRTYIADSPQQAFQALEERYASLESFKTDVVLRLSGEMGAVDLKGRIDFDRVEGWKIVLRGPLGVRVVSIKSVQDGFQINSRDGQVLMLKPGESLEIPEFNITISDITAIATLIVPTVKLDIQHHWVIKDAEIANPGHLSLVEQASGSNDSLFISLDYNPVLPRTDEYWSSGNQKYKRQFFYDRKSGMHPAEIELAVDNFTLNIRFESLHMVFDKANNN